MAVTAPPPSAPELVRPARRPARTRKIVLIVIGALVALAVVGGLGIYFVVDETTKEPQKVSDRFVDAVQRGDGAAAYALTGSAFRSLTTERQLNRLVRRLDPLVTQERSIEGKSINVGTDYGKVAVFVYKVNATRADSIYFKTQLGNEDGRWRVLTFQASPTELSTDVD
jgi:hypothetical protein